MYHPKLNALRTSDRLFRDTHMSYKNHEVTERIRNREQGKHYYIRHEVSHRATNRLRDAPTEDGVYNYIIFYDEPNYIPKFILVNPMLEYGTKHFHLRGDSHLVIFAAGEMHVSKGRIWFNLLSGTYTLKILESVKNKGLVKDYMIRKLREVFKVYSSHVTYTEDKIVEPYIKSYKRHELKNIMLYNING